MNKKFYNWIRQSRYRAKKHGVINKLHTKDVCNLLDELNNICAYCEETADNIDHPFPLSNKAPNVLANILPICTKCKAQKATADLVAYFNDGKISQDKFMGLLRSMLERDGAEYLRQHVKSITGIES